MKDKTNGKDNIVQVDVRKQYMSNMARYSLYTLFERYTPDIRDGLKPVQRRILYCMWHDVKCLNLATKRKSANTVGAVMASYHPHGNCLRGDTLVYLLSGEKKTIKELYDSGIASFEALGVNETTLKTEPVIAHDLRIGQYTNKVYHIQLSNGAELQCTSNHPIMLKTGAYIKAEEIVPGMLIMTKYHYCTNKTGTDHRPAIGGELIQDIVWYFYNGPIEPGFVKHHLDENKFNNTIGNLGKLSIEEHALLHNDYNKGLGNGKTVMADLHSLSHTIFRNRFFFNIEKLIAAGIQPNYQVYLTTYPQWENKITDADYNYLYSLFCDTHPFVVNVWTEDVNNEPMYDFTVDTTHNMLFPVIGPNNTDTDFPMICLHNSAIYGAMKVMTNWFEIKVPLLVYDSNSGSLQGGPQAAERYTESCLSQFSIDAILDDLAENRMIVDWNKTFDKHTDEPEYLPVKIPLLLVNGTFGIAIGRRIEVPSHSLNDVIDATIDVLHNPNAKVILIPDPCQKCEIIDTDWKKISNMGYGNYVERGIVKTVTDEKTGHQYLSIQSVPDMVFSDTVMEKIEELIKQNKLVQIADIQDHSTEDQLDIRLILKKGSDAEYVKQVIYKNTSLQDTKRVNMEVIDGNEIIRVSYKAYIVNFLEFRRSVKFRLYNIRLQKAETRLHTTEIFIRILESGEVEKIIHMIRNQKPSEEAQLIEWLMNKLNITDVQAKFVLNTEIKKLSKGSLAKYKEEQTRLTEEVKHYIEMITRSELIDAEIEAELLEIKAKYGKPRQSIIISEAEASDIPQGVFKVVVYESGFVKKMQINDPIKSYKGDNPKCVTVGDNTKDLLLFDEMGKVFRLPIHKIAFTDKNSPGIDVRMILKKLTSNIISVMYLPILEELANKTSKYFVVTVSKQGLIKKMDLDDLINTTPSGIIYSKLNKGDSICDIVIANHKSDIIVYTKSKALRISIDSIPYLKRATLGNIAMKTDEEIDGISVVTAETKDVVIVTAKGKFNRISQAALPRSDRNKAGSKVIKLAKGDYITNIFTCSSNSVIRCIHMDGTITEVLTDSIEMGSSVSAGVKLTKEIIKAEISK